MVETPSLSTPRIAIIISDELRKGMLSITKEGQPLSQVKILSQIQAGHAVLCG